MSKGLICTIAGTKGVAMCRAMATALEEKATKLEAMEDADADALALADQHAMSGSNVAQPGDPSTDPQYPTPPRQSPNGSVARRRLNSACPICTPGAKGLFKWGDALDHLLASHPSLVSWERNMLDRGALLGGFRCCCGFVTTSTDSMMDHLKQTDLVDHFTLAKIGAPE